MQAGLPIDLPTEAQWEYAARSGGKQLVYPTDDGTRDEGRNVSTLAQRAAPSGRFLTPNTLLLGIARFVA